MLTYIKLSINFILLYVDSFVLCILLKPLLSRYDASGIGVVRAESLLKKLGIEFRESRSPSSSVFASLNGREENEVKKSVSLYSAREFKFFDRCEK